MILRLSKYCYELRGGQSFLVALSLLDVGFQPGWMIETTRHCQEHIDATTRRKQRAAARQPIIRRAAPWRPSTPTTARV